MTARGPGKGNLIDTLAEWVHGLDVRDIPADVLDLARAQKRSVIAGAVASMDDEASRRVLSAVGGWAAPGPAPLIGSGLHVRVEDALYAAAALSVALDFDDYLCFAHTGHSAVWLPLMLATETGSPVADQLAAQVVANEIGGRIGGACLIGPQNGQMWSFVHALEGAAAAARILGLSRTETAHAMAISLSAPPRATAPGFFMPDSKLLTAAEPLCLGLRAARLASAGATGPLDILDGASGFLGAFSAAPLRGALAGLGEAWTTRTISIKPYPGCAYIDTAVDALLSLGSIAVQDIEAIAVETNVLSFMMDILSRQYTGVPATEAGGGKLVESTSAHAGDGGSLATSRTGVGTGFARSAVRQAGGTGPAVPTPVAINFSLSWSLAVAALNGALTPATLRGDVLTRDAPALNGLVAKTEIRHDWALTNQAIASFDRIVPRLRVLREAGLSGLVRAGITMGPATPRGASPMDLAQGIWPIVQGLVSTTARMRLQRLGGLATVGSLLGLGRRGGQSAKDARATEVGWGGEDTRDKPDPGGREAQQGSGGGRDSWWDPSAIERFAMVFPTRIEVRLTDGSRLKAESSTPKGAAGMQGDAGPQGVASRKLAESVGSRWGEVKAALIEQAIAGDDPRLAGLLG